MRAEHLFTRVVLTLVCLRRGSFIISQIGKGDHSAYTHIIKTTQMCVVGLVNTHLLLFYNNEIISTMIWIYGPPGRKISNNNNNNSQKKKITQSSKCFDCLNRLLKEDIRS